MSSALAVVVQTPAHSGLAGPLRYRSELALAPGTLVRVPLGTRETLGVVWDGEAPGLAEGEARPVTAVLDGIAPLNLAWRRLVGFAAGYYQRALGEVALAALPPQLRELDAAQWERRLKRRKPAEPVAPAAALPPEPSAEQAQALAQIAAAPGPFVLFGSTGSGKTEVYLRAVQDLLLADPQAQALVMVPEINLTPQLQERFVARFAPLFGRQALVSLHSGMTPAQRLASWLSAHAGPGAGGARIVLGTRMAVFASMPGLRLIVVDEEHDPSYKQQEGARYSARDLAIYRAQLESRLASPGAQVGPARCRVLLGSATPSLETWHHSRPAAEGGKYQRLAMPSRVGLGRLPAVRLVDMNQQPRKTVFAPALLAAIAERIARGEQAMVLLNRRGYAPVLACGSCDWKSECPNCSAYRVFHKIDRTLRCHHCGFTERVPRACPSCGDIDLAPVGRGTERLQEHLEELLAGLERPGAEGEDRRVRVLRIDADSTRHKGALETQLAQVHAGDVDVLVGTQMIAKGHDFRRITLVAALNPDGALFSSDFRAPERLFSLLMQAAGRAGRDAAHGAASEMWIQTDHPQHALFAALRRHDYPAFAKAQLEEREQAGMPPFSFQALVRADARTQEAAQAFLNLASQGAAGLPGAGDISLYAAVPMTIQRVANVERAQMLVESPSRAALQRFLAAWLEVLRATRQAPEAKGVIRWAVDVDPLSI
ncbi:primosomal protein N' [Pseudorhodoferax sp. Leaf267]|uniref:replication restart helicase PriA n=1 Tax=Pseudorhodoferax sp. Leaf267 TaxID=1736316 RepID=UPI0006F3509A|nr:primosomal protein N' [Pseudorhodoferax sp. Leaf267]KQP12309.1 primosomal protein N' [Pseudorhodoferax sp. Leaf267]